MEVDGDETIPTSTEQQQTIHLETTRTAPSRSRPTRSTTKEINYKMLATRSDGSGRSTDSSSTSDYQVAERYEQSPFPQVNTGSDKKSSTFRDGMSSLSPPPVDLDQEPPTVYRGKGLLRFGGNFPAKQAKKPDATSNPKKVLRLPRTASRRTSAQNYHESTSTIVLSKKRHHSEVALEVLDSESEPEEEHRSSEYDSENPEQEETSKRLHEPAPKRAAKSGIPNSNSKGRTDVMRKSARAEAHSPASIYDVPSSSGDSAYSGPARSPPSLTLNPGFAPPPITKPDKYVSTRPMTNNQAIRLFDIMALRMDWTDETLYEQAGLSNMSGIRRAAAERFYRGEMRNILQEGLAEAEGRLCQPNSYYDELIKGNDWVTGEGYWED